MAKAQMDSVIRHLHQVMLRQDGAGRTDGQLLASFIDQKDEAAFEALVRRHGPMVLGVCRRIVRNHHDAEDAFQATFLVLACKAASVKPRERVANWLHGVALRTALKAKAMTAKRRGREKQVKEMPEPAAVPQDQWRDLQPLLDQELNSLPEKYRLPILLCDLESNTIKEAAQQLGWPQGTLASRLARGRKLLAKRLASRGVALSAGSLAAVVSQNAVSAGVPTSLMTTTVKAAAVIAAGQAAVAGVVPAKVAALMEGVLKAMLLNKLKGVMAVLVVALAGVGTGTGLLGYAAVAGQQNESKKGDAVTPNQKTAENKGKVYFDVAEYPSVVQEIVYQGAHHLKPDELDTLTGLKKGMPLNPVANLMAQQAILRRLHEKGRMFAGVELVEGNKPGDTRVVFRIVEGPVVKAMTAKRQKEDNKAEIVSPNKEVAKSDKDQLLGKWLLVSCNCNGKDRMQPWFKDNSRLVIEEADGKLVCKTLFKDKAKLIELFGQEEMEQRMLWADMAGESPAKVIERFGEEMEKNTQGILKLDARTKPQTLDVISVVPLNGIYLGIYKLDGDTLTWCWSKALTPEVAKAGKDRPTDFSTTSGDGRTLMVYKRQKEHTENDTAKDQAVKQANKNGANHDTAKTDLESIQGIWSVVSIEQGGKPAKLEKAVFMVDGKRACWQTCEFEMQGGLYLDPTSKPKTYDFVMSERTIEGIYSLDGGTLRLCQGTKRPVGFATRKDSQVLFVLKRIHGPEVFPFRLPDGTRAFPPFFEKKGKTPLPPQTAPTPKDGSLTPYKMADRTAKVGRIIIVGNTKTETSVILKMIPLSPGDVLDYQALRTAEKNLAAFSPTITVEESSDSADFRDIRVTVKEK
jgi:RNA polymerase sigma factor (sigma-70 family)